MIKQIDDEIDGSQKKTGKKNFFIDFKVNFLIGEDQKQ